MTASRIEFGSGDVALSKAVIPRDWVIEGDPKTQNVILSRSADGGAWTLIWECTAGKFNWIYDIDETIYVLEGGAVIEDETGAAHKVTVGSTVYFPAGTRAVWHVEGMIRKVAFFRNPVPAPLMLTARVYNKLMRLFAGAKPGSASAMAPVDD